MFIQGTAEAHLDCFHFGAMLTNAPMNIPDDEC